MEYKIKMWTMLPKSIAFFLPCCIIMPDVIFVSFIKVTEKQTSMYARHIKKEEKNEKEKSFICCNFCSSGNGNAVDRLRQHRKRQFRQFRQLQQSDGGGHRLKEARIRPALRLLLEVSLQAARHLAVTFFRR